MTPKSIFLSITSRVLVISIVFGLVSGIIGASITISALKDYQTRVEQQTRPLGTTENIQSTTMFSTDALLRMKESSLRRVVMLYPKSAKGTYGFSSDASIGTGVVLTSDGWIAIGSLTAGFTPDQLTAHVDDHLYNVTQMLVDPISAIVFAKLQATNLPVISFGQAFDMRIGEPVFVVNSSTSFVLGNIKEHIWPQGTIVSSDVPSRRLTLVASSFYAGNIVFDVSGSLIGFGVKKDSSTIMMPLEVVLPALTSLLETKKISRNALGIQYLDLAHTVAIPEKFSRGYFVGAYVTGRPAVRRGSPAALAGLNEGDILLAVNGQFIDKTHGLDERLLSYRVGETVLIAFDRLGEKKTAQIILGELVK